MGNVSTNITDPIWQHFRDDAELGGLYELLE
jgi:hypothetical protein